MNLREQRKKLEAQLQMLKTFTNTATVRKLRRELNEKLRAVDIKLGKREKLVKPPPSTEELRKQVNISRSNKLRKYHNYLRQIRNRYPDLKYAELTKMFRERKEGNDVSIPDVIWQNPSQ